MKIGIVCPYDITKGGGVQEIVKSQVEGLARRGHEAYLITPRPRDHDGLPEDHVIFVGGSADLRSPGHTTVQISAGLTDDIERMLEQYNFDVLNFHEPWLPMLSRQILSRSQAANVATFHAKLPETVMMRTMARVVEPYTRSVLKYIDAFVAASEAGGEYVTTLTDEPVAIIPVNIDLDKFTQRPEPASAGLKTILYVGRLEGRKGVKYLLHAFAQLQQEHKDVKLDILGDGVDRDKLEMLAADLEVKRVTFLGFRDNEEKIRRFQKADVYCSPALFGEGFGMVLLEAMATGVPAVVGDNPGYAAVMRDMGALSLVNPQDIPEFTRRLELMLYQQDIRDLWRKWAEEEVQQYSTERMIDRYETVYRQAIKKKSRS
jgi:phosphatidyl-myo-inositol alpha-mannosyltransferase